MFEKCDVNGENTHDVFKFLRCNSMLYDKSNNLSQQIPWNFSKFIVDKNGQVKAFFSPTTKYAQIRAYITGSSGRNKSECVNVFTTLEPNTNISR